MNVIEVNNLSFSYGDNINAIDNVSFKIKEGSYTTIIGHNGSGKSTIAKLLIGLLEPLKGNIMVEGVPLTLENLSIIRENWYCFQNPDNQFVDLL